MLVYFPLNMDKEIEKVTKPLTKRLTKAQHEESVRIKRLHEMQRQAARDFLAGKTKRVDASILCDEVSDRDYDEVFKNTAYVTSAPWEVA